MKDLISISIPVYNCEKYVRQTLDSVLKQTYTNLEILVVDDGSTDSSPAICDEYLADSRVKVFHRQNAGVAESRQFAFENSNGAYYATIDSDDYIAEDFIEKLYNSIKQNNADVSVCGVTFFADKTSEITSVFLPTASYERLAVTEEILATDFYKLSYDLILNDSWNKMYKSEFVKNSGVKYWLDKIYRGSELMFNHRLALHCPVYSVCKQALLFHRSRAGSAVKKKDKPLQQGLEIITESLIEECKSVGISIKAQMGAVYYSFVGLVAMDIFVEGGSMAQKHKKFKAMLLRNKAFIKKHTADFDSQGLKNFYISRFTLPSFMLGNALWLDAFFICYNLLTNVKRRVLHKKSVG